VTVYFVGAGHDVVRLHTGDPSIYGAIGEQMRALTARRIPYDVVPGVSSFQAAAAALHLELTAPEISQTVILSRLAGRTPVPAEQSIAHLASTHATLCLFLSVHKLDEAVGTLAEQLGSDCPVAVVYRASWPDQQVLRGTLHDIAAQVKAAGIQRTAMVIVGRALQAELPASKLYDATFAHGYRPARSP
jgi:precorrin-4/cobalt-precorrin-4 C11-methyltransferase